MRRLAIAFVLLFAGAVESHSQTSSEIDATMAANVKALNSAAPIQRGDWTFTRASYDRTRRAITYHIKDKTVVLAEISVKRYRSLMQEPIRKDVCSKVTAFKKFGVTVIYVISDKNGQFITNTTIRAGKC
ncbi:MAG: hypothetical protein ABIK36_16490 [Pseudomonadota bacterium]